MTQSPFLPSTNIQFAYDSVSLGLLKECPRKYYYTMIQGYSPKGERVHLRFGIEMHSALENYDKLRAANPTYSHDDLLRIVVKDCLVANQNFPQDHPTKNLESLIRSVIWYLDEYRDDPAQTYILADGSPAVELSFKFPTGIMVNETPILYCGHIDRLVRLNNDTLVVDRKTTGGAIGAFFFRQFSPDNQMSGYSVAAKVVFKTLINGVLIDAIQVQATQTQFARSFTYRTDAQLDEWLDDLSEWASLQKYYAERDKWPMNDKSCHKYDGCQYRDICSHDPRVRKEFLQTNFEVNRWNPLENR